MRRSLLPLARPYFHFQMLLPLSVAAIPALVALVTPGRAAVFMQDPAAGCTRVPVAASMLDRAVAFTQGREAGCTEGQGRPQRGRAAVCTQVQAAEFIRDRPEGRTPTRVLGVHALPA